MPASDFYTVDSNPGGIDAGDYYVRLVLANPQNYQWRTVDTDYIDIQYTITKAEASAVITANNLTYNAGPQVLVIANTVTGGTIGYSLTEGDYVADIPTGTNAGSYTVYWKITPDSNHTENSGYVPVIIKKATPTLEAVTPTLTYNASAQNLIAVNASTTEVSVLYSLDGGDFVSTVPKGTNAGTYSVQYKSLETDNYNASALGSATVIIAKATYDSSYIQFVSDRFQYDGTEKSIVISVDPNHPLPDEISVQYTNNTKTTVGTNSNVTATFIVSDNYTPIAPLTGRTLEIYVLPIKYSAVGYSGTYDGVAHNMVAVTVTAPATGALITYSTSSGGPYSETCPTVTDVGSGAVFFKITALGYTDVTDTKNYSVSKITVTVSSVTDSRVYDGTPFTAPDLTLSAGTLVTGHHISGTATGTITNVGSVQNPFDVVILDGSENNVTANYEVKKSVGVLSVTKATFNASYIHFDDAQLPYDGNAHTLEIVMEPGHPLPAEIVPHYQNNTGTNIGSYNATVTFTVGDNYNQLAGMSATLTIYDSEMVISAIGYSGVYDAQSHYAITVTVTYPTEFTVTYSLDNETYTAERPAMKDADSLEIWYKIEAYGFNPVNAKVVATVSKIHMTITSDNAEKVYDTTELIAHHITTDNTVAAGQTLTIAYLGTQTNAGVSDNMFTAKVVEGETDVTANYELTKVYGKLTVMKAVYDSQHIHFVDTEYQYDGTMKTLTITTDPGYDLPDEITPVYSNNSKIAPNTYNATVNFVVSQNYQPLPAMSAKLKIYESTFEYTATAYNGTYDGVAHNTVTVTVTTVGAVVTYSTNGSPYTSECPTITNVGQSLVYYKIELLGYTTITKNVSAVVSKHSVTISSGSASKTYDGTALSLPELTVTGGSLVAGHVVEGQATASVINATATPVANQFNAVIKDANGNNVSNNYAITKNVGTLTVSKANAKIVITPHEPFPFEINVTRHLDYTVEGLKGDDEIRANLKYVNSASQIVNPSAAGTYTVTVDNYQAIHGSLSNYNVDKDSSVETLTILPRTVQAPAADPTDFIYDGNLKTYVIADSNYYTVQNNTQVQAGSYTVTVMLVDTVNCAWSTGSSANLTYDFVIGQRAIRVVADQISKVYGEADPEFTYTVYNTAPGESAAFSGTAVAASHDIGDNDVLIGTLALINNGAFRAANYTFTFEGDGRFTITPFIVELPAAPGEFGTLIYTGDELTAYEDGPYYTVVGGKATEVGNYTATLTLVDTVNFVWSDTRDSSVRNLQYRIVLATIDLLFTPYTGVYDGLYHDAAVINDADGATVYYGFDMMGWTTEVPKVKNVQNDGILYIKAVKDKHEDFYAVVDFQISKARLDVYADDKLITLSDPLPEFTFRAEGFVNGETLDDLTCEIVFGTPYEPGQGWGVYAITCISGPVDMNYEIITHDGVLTVAAHKVKVIWTYTEYLYTKTEQKVYVMLQDENGDTTSCNASVTDKDGNPVVFRDIGDYVATAVLPEGYVLDPEYADTVTAELKIVENEAFEFNPITLLMLILIASIGAYLIYDQGFRKK